jgi:hypothetical protein
MDDSDQLSSTGRRGNRGDGPDTVRILPDSTPRSAPGSDADEWRVERPVVRSGTLYTRVPADAAQHVVEPGHAIEPLPQQSREVVSAGQRSIQAQDASTPQPVTVVRKGPSACSIIAATLSLLMLSCAVLAFFTLRNGLDGLGKLGGLIPSFGLVTTPTITIDTSRPAVIDRVQALSKLETVRYELDKVITAESTGPLWGMLKGNKLLLVAHGEVVGGVDLGKLKPEDITVISDVVTIKMPEPEILFSKLNRDKTYVYDWQSNLFSPPDPNLLTQAEIAAEEEIVEAAREGRILENAALNAENVIRSLVIGLGYEEVRFTHSP